MMTKMNTKDRILIWQDVWFFLFFGTAKVIQERLDCRLFSIIDADEKVTNFFEHQNIVNFEKSWYFMKETLEQKNPDIKYLKSFEDKYKINLWDIIYSDKYFYPEYNPHHNFAYRESLSLIEAECKFFEKVLDEVNPNFLIMLLPASHHNQLLYTMCKSRGIKILMLVPTKFRYRMLISENDFGIDKTENIEPHVKRKRTEQEIQDYWPDSNLLPFITKIEKEYFHENRFKRYTSILRFFIDSNYSKYQNRYYNKGRTKFRIFKEKVSRSLYRKSRQSFIDANLKKQLGSDEQFVYFPLHYEPEKITLTIGKFFPDQIAVTKIIARSLPIGYKLYVKDHPYMKTIGWRDISYYKKIMGLPNVELLHPSISHEEIMKKCSLVVTIAGTAALEAAFAKKPSIILTDVDYGIPSIKQVTNLDQLENIIRICLDTNVDISTLNDYLDIIENNSFEFDFHSIGSDFSNRFNFKGPIMDADLPIHKMENFIDDNMTSFNKLAEEFIKKIKKHKELYTSKSNTKSMSERNE